MLFSHTQKQRFCSGKDFILSGLEGTQFKLSACISDWYRDGRRRNSSVTAWPTAHNGLKKGISIIFRILGFLSFLREALVLIRWRKKAADPTHRTYSCSGIQKSQLRRESSKFPWLSQPWCPQRTQLLWISTALESSPGTLCGSRSSVSIGSLPWETSVMKLISWSSYTVSWSYKNCGVLIKNISELLELRKMASQQGTHFLQINIHFNN